MMQKIIDKTDILRFYRLFIKNIHIYSVFGFLLISYLFFRNKVSLDSQVVKLRVPEIPTEIWSQMKSQNYYGAINFADKDWFEYYDPVFKTRVEVKMSGLSARHYDSEANSSFRMKFLDYDLRFKSLASEVGLANPINSYEAFTEIGIYDVAKNYYKYVPTGKLVTFNNNNKNIYIQWEDNFGENIRENDFVNWSQLAKFSLHVPDKQERYFDFAWKVRDDKDKDTVSEFIKLMDEVYAYEGKEIDSNNPGNFNLENYIRYLALASIFGSGHLDSHNLVFIPDEKKGEYEWNLALVDLASLKYEAMPTPFLSPNPISAFFLRNPHYMYLYQQELYDLDQQILQRGGISKAFDKYSCDRVKNYEGFNELLMKVGYQGGLNLDINSYCFVLSKIADYEKVRSIDLNNQLDYASLLWQLTEEGDDQYIIFDVPTIVGVEVTDIECFGRNCKKNLELENPPWWQENYHDYFFLPMTIRRDEKDKTEIIPGYYRYKFKWLGDKNLSKSDISIKAKNVVTGSDVYPVADFYPSLDIKPDREKGNRTKFDLKLKIINPVIDESGYRLLESELTLGSKPDSKNLNNWTLEVDSTCDKKEVSKLEYTLDCTNVNLAAWPYPLFYKVRLYHKNVLIRDYIGEIYIKTPDLPITREVLSNDNLNDYKVSNLAEINSISPITLALLRKQLEDQSFDTSEMTILIEEAKDIYFIPSGKRLEIIDDLILSEDSLFIIDDSVHFYMWPLTKAKFGTVIALGDPNGEGIKFLPKENIGAWHNLEIAHGAYLSNFDTNSTKAIDGGLVLDYADLVLLDSQLHGRSNISCENCNIFVRNTEAQYGDWVLQAKDSHLDIDGVDILNADHGFILEDSRGIIKNINLSANEYRGFETTDRVFEIIGPSTDLTIDNVTLDETNSLLSKYLFPKVEVTNVNVERVNTQVLNLDSEEHYSQIINQDSEDFYNLYSYLVRKDKDDSSVMSISSGVHRLYEDVLIPKTVTLIIDPGATFISDKKVDIISYGEVVAKGTAEDPIIFKAENNKEWGIFALRGSEASGEFENVVFEDGGYSYVMGTNYSGALNAHAGASLRITNSTIKTSKGDDGLNCKNSTCTVSYNTFEKNGFDGVDFDFSAGEISHNEFINNGNDGIDLSFDSSYIFDNNIINSGDKGISVGEQSNSIIYKNNISGNGIGIEVKDNSEEYIIENSIKDNKIGISAYRKKAAFINGGFPIMYQNQMSNEQEFDIDKWSRVDELENLDNTQELEEKYRNLVHMLENVRLKAQ